MEELSHDTGAANASKTNPCKKCDRLFDEALLDCAGAAGSALVRARGGVQLQARAGRCGSTHCSAVAGLWRRLRTVIQGPLRHHFVPGYRPGVVAHAVALRNASP